MTHEILEVEVIAEIARVAALNDLVGCASACRRAARFGVSPTTAVSDAVPSPIWSPTITVRWRCRSAPPARLRAAWGPRHSAPPSPRTMSRPARADRSARPHGRAVAEIEEDAVAHVLGDKAFVAPDRIDRSGSETM